LTVKFFKKNVLSTKTFFIKDEEIKGKKEGKQPTAV
jgi:hypothetical protein